MNFISLCSGIEAASVAFGPLGWKAIAFSEIEGFPSAVLAHHYPTVRNYGDMSLFRDWPDELFADADAIVGGPPCQAFSVAGLRKSLDDERGNLSLTFCEIADAIDHVRGMRGQPPSIIFWENVPGVLSTRDNAFGCFLGELAGESGPLEPAGRRWTDAGCVYGPARAVAWRVLDAQYFGLAQRRRRVFVVASARKGFDPATVLFEWDGMRRDTAPGREARQSAAGCFARSVALRGREGGGTIELGDDVGGCLRASSGGGDKPHVLTVCQPAAFGGHQLTPDVAQCLTTGTGQRYDTETDTILPVAASGVRRLTTRECERLMGFQDDYTAIPWRNKAADQCPDGPRYRALGNSWAVPVARWVGRRINDALAAAKP